MCRKCGKIHLRCILLDAGDRVMDKLYQVKDEYDKAEDHPEYRHFLKGNFDFIKAGI